MTFTKEVPLADADGGAIFEGSVLKRIDRDTRGVVTKIFRQGDRGPIFAAVGDMSIWEKPGHTTISNAYAMWRHVPHDEQTRIERVISRQRQGYFRDGYSQMSREEEELYWTILHLLPEGYVNWEYGDTPMNGREALVTLANYMDELKAGAKEPEERVSEDPTTDSNGLRDLSDLNYDVPE